MRRWSTPLNIGDKVKAVNDIKGGLSPFVPAGTEGFVVGRSAWSLRLEVDFSVPGLLTGTRAIRTMVEPGQIAKV